MAKKRRPAAKVVAKRKQKAGRKAPPKVGLDHVVAALDAIQQQLDDIRAVLAELGGGEMVKQAMARVPPADPCPPAPYSASKAKRGRKRGTPSGGHPHPGPACDEPPRPAAGCVDWPADVCGNDPGGSCLPAPAPAEACGKAAQEKPLPPAKPVKQR